MVAFMDGSWNQARRWKVGRAWGLRELPMRERTKSTQETIGLKSQVRQLSATICWARWEHGSFSGPLGRLSSQVRITSSPGPESSGPGILKLLGVRAMSPVFASLHPGRGRPGPAGHGRSRTPLRGRDLQFAGDPEKPLQERVQPDRRSVEAALRPDSQPDRGGQGVHEPRAGDTRGRGPGAKPGGDRPAEGGGKPRRSRRDERTLAPPTGRSPVSWADCSRWRKAIPT